MKDTGLVKLKTWLDNKPALWWGSPQFAGNLWDKIHALVKEEQKEISDKEPLAKEIIKNLLTWFTHDIPKAPTHYPCGPESCCDVECVHWVYFCKDIDKARAFLEGLK